jgi:uncharacterized delta-60 repeat protein
VALQSDGRILVAGAVFPASGAPGSYAVCRLTPAGALDLSFGTSGRSLIEFPGLSGGAVSVAVADDDSFVTGGTVGTNAAQDMAFARFASNGAPAAFGTTGRVVLDMHGNSDRATAVAFQDDGKIVFSGRSALSNAYAPSFFVVGRLTSRGSLDPTFGSGGVTETSFSGFADQAAALVIDRSGHIAVAGDANGTGPGSLMTWAIARYQR